LIAILIIIVLFVNLLILILIIFYPYKSSYSQWIIPPMPSPFDHTSVCCKNGINKTGSLPPQILIMTHILYEGNNVLKLKIIDNLPLIQREINYTVGNHSITTYMAKEHNNEYKSLIKVISPQTKIEVAVKDLNNNYAKLVKEIKVENWFNVIISSITNSSFWKIVFQEIK
jgi:hypothetical protein